MSARLLKAVGSVLLGVGFLQVALVAMLYGWPAWQIALAALVTGGGGLYIIGLGVAHGHMPTLMGKPAGMPMATRTRTRTVWQFFCSHPMATYKGASAGPIGKYGEQTSYRTVTYGECERCGAHLEQSGVLSIVEFNKQTKEFHSLMNKK